MKIFDLKTLFALFVLYFLFVMLELSDAVTKRINLLPFLF
jgi:hypothetical protein